MALTKATIIFNFNRALQQAEELEDIANDLSKISRNEFANTMQSVSVNWKGENAGKYLMKGTQIQENMNSTAASLLGIASDIKKTAQRIYKAEMRALAIAETRNN